MQTRLPLTVRPFGQTKRPDMWWLYPLLTFLGLSAFVVYSTWAAFQGVHYASGPYLSPLYSPELFGDSPHAWFGPKPSLWPDWLPYSPAFLILWAPAGFRFTCYYYRGAYYKAFWIDPPSCTVGEPRKGYRGEQKLPLILQNVASLLHVPRRDVPILPQLRRDHGFLVQGRGGQRLVRRRHRLVRARAST